MNMNQDLFDLLQLCLIVTKKSPMTAGTQSVLHDGLTLIVYEEARPGFLAANRSQFEQCRDTLKALTP